MTRRIAAGISLAAALCAAGTLADEPDIVRVGAYTVRFTACPKCPGTLRLGDDGRSAFVNTSRLLDGRPDAATLRKLRAEWVKRAVELLKAAERRNGPENASREKRT